MSSEDARASGRGRTLAAGLAVGAALLAGAIAVPIWLARGGERGSEARTDGAIATPSNARAWSAEVERVQPTDGDGLFVRAPGSRTELALDPRQHVPAGSTVRTDERTEARLRLTDGSVLVLDRATEVEILADRPRGLRLRQGSLRADVIHLPVGPRAEVLGQHGRVEVVGTRFRVTEALDRTVVEVQRGMVRFGVDAHPVEVGEGQEAVAERGGAVRIYASSQIDSSPWFEEGDESTDEDGEAIPGLGELRARRPGEREEQLRPLSLAEHRVSVKIVGSVARTEIEETFQNDDDATLEGIYRFPLPDGARIASLELEVDGRFERGAFVERERARRIFRGVIRHSTPTPRREPREEIVWVPGPWRDPALLEQQRGGRFELRIFPIPAHGSRRIRIAYEEDVKLAAGRRRYVYPLPSVRRGEARVGRFAVDVEIDGHDASLGLRSAGYDLRTAGSQQAPRLSFEAASFAPSGDLGIEYALEGGEATLRYAQFRGDAVSATAPARGGRGTTDEVETASRALEVDERGYVVFTLRPELPAEAMHQPTDYAIVVDSSQSMYGESHRRAIRTAEQLAGGLDRRHRVVVLACDLACRTAPEGLLVPSPDAARSARAFLDTVRPGGASNLVASLAAAARELGNAPGRARSVVYVGDGAASSGPVGLELISAEVEALAQAAGISVSTVAISGDADARTLDAIARAGAGHFVPVHAGQRVAEVAEALIAATSGPALVAPVVEFPAGVEAVAPSALPTLRPGTEVKLTARVRGPVTGDLVVRGKLSGRAYERRYPVRLEENDSGRNAFVPRLWASARIAELERTGGSEAEIVALSERFGVISQATSLLVLESEAMFQAYGLDRSNGPLQWSGDEGIEETTFGEADDAETEVADLMTSGSSSEGRSRAGGAGPSADGMAPAASGAFSAPPRASRAAAEEARPAPAPMAPPPPIRGPGRYMRRVAYREATIRGAEGVSRRELDALAQAEAALAAEPDHRDRVRDVVRAALRAGRSDSVEKTLAAWLERDPSDVDALTLASDVAHAAGRFGESVRLLSGIVESDPRDAALQNRVAEAFERSGDERSACAHRLAVASVATSDAGLVRRGAECARLLRLDASARLLESRAATFVGRIDGASPRALDDVRGELVLDARFSGGDVDLVVVTPRGERISFLGGRTGVTAREVRSASSEALGLRSARLGSYRVEVVRAGEDARTIRGTVRIRVLGTSRELPFELVGRSATVGRIEVAQRFRMVPM